LYVLSSYRFIKGGCSTKVKPDGTEQIARMCPRCNNGRPCNCLSIRSAERAYLASVFSAKRTEWFELFWIPLIPMGSKHVWMCNICQFMALVTPGCVRLWMLPSSDVTLYRQWEPAIAGRGFPPPGPTPYYGPGVPQAGSSFSSPGQSPPGPPQSYQPAYMTPPPK
jgi:hypothetical protein